MGIRYNDSALIVGKQYLVQDVSKFPKAKAFLKGKTPVLVSVNQTSCSVRFTGQLHEIPVRSLFHVVGYEAKGVHAKNADGFIIKCSNEFHIPTGTAFLEPDSVSETHAIFTIEGKEVKLPLNILVALVRKVTKVKDSKVKKEAKESGVPLSVLEAVAGAVKVDPLTQLPSAVTKLLPDLNMALLISKVKENTVEVWDFDGNIHDNIMDAQKSNERFIHHMIQKVVMAEVKSLLNGQFEGIRDDF